MRALRKYLVRSQGFALALLGAFVLCVGLPWIDTFHHDHPGGSHFHVHPELGAGLSPLPRAHTHGQPVASVRSHAHAHAHHSHSHVHHGRTSRAVVDHRHHHQHNHGTAPRIAVTASASKNLVSTPQDHWHTRVNLQHAYVPQQSPWGFLRLENFFQPATPSFWFVPPSFPYPPRTPPRFC